MRIALIAMSGIRACDEELLRLGLTLPGFVERSKAIASLPSLGLLTLAGMTPPPPEHEVSYLEVADIRQIDSLPGDFDLVAISTFSAQANEALQLARRYAARGTPVVIGGLHVTSLSDEVVAAGISAAVGEGEIIWPQILADARRGELKPVYDARGREFDLAAAPMPAYELLDISNYNRLTVQTSRGCPWKCSFCASSILLTGRYKQKPVGKVLAEVDRIGELWDRPFVELADDNSFVNRGYWRTLLPELGRRRIRWFAETDISVAYDAKLLSLMRQAGCVEVLIGLESPTAEALDWLELRRNWKRQQFERYRQAVHAIQSQGIRVNACFVVGLDAHDAGVFEAVEGFVDEAGPFDVQVTLPTPFPGTPFYHSLKQQGRLLHDGRWERCTLFDVNFTPARMTADELARGFRGLVSRLYSDEATRQRRERFHEQARGCRAVA